VTTPNTSVPCAAVAELFADADADADADAARGSGDNRDFVL